MAFAFQRRSPPVDPPTTLDEDVDLEQRLAREAFDRGGDREEQALVVKDMSKRFGDFRAVKGLSFTVKQGEERPKKRGLFD